jgi:hypothetical protein
MRAAAAEGGSAVPLPCRFHLQLSAGDEVVVRHEVEKTHPER